MPRGNRTGPMGMGPRTGRGMGYCSGYTVPGYAHGAPMGGRGRGMGWGPQNRYAVNEPPYFPEPMTAKEEAKLLEQTLENLKSQIKTIEKRMESLDADIQK